MRQNSYPLSRQSNVVIQELKKEVLVYDLSLNRALCLNPTATMVWNECNGKNSIAEISRSLSRKMESQISEEIVWLALKQLKEERLLENGWEFVNDFERLSRREIVKRIGIASMVALPLISAIVAPTAASAQSSAQCLKAGETGCSTAANCCRLQNQDARICLNGTCCIPSGDEICTDDLECCSGSCDTGTGICQ